MGLFDGVLSLLESEITTASDLWRQPALKRVNAFASETAAGKWTGLPRVTAGGPEGVADRLKELINDPDQVWQGCIGTCGPAAFLRCYIDEDPDGFALLATSLYDNGQARLGNLALTPGSDLLATDYAGTAVPAMIAASKKAATPADFVVPSAEWMFMSALQDTINQFMDYTGLPDWPYEWLSFKNTLKPMQRVFTACGVYQDVKVVPVPPAPDRLSSLRALQPSATVDVVMLVNSRIITDAQPELGNEIAAFVNSDFDHYIVLNDAITEAEDDPTKLRLQAWCWRKNYDFPIDPAFLAANYGGAIVATVRTWP